LPAGFRQLYGEPDQEQKLEVTPGTQAEVKQTETDTDGQAKTSPITALAHGINSRPVACPEHISTA